MVSAESTSEHIFFLDNSLSSTVFLYTSTIQRLFRKFSLLFEYPTEVHLRDIEEMEHLTKTLCPKAHKYLQQFKNSVVKLNITQLQEFYSDLIDMSPGFHPYLAAHLVGESYKRSLFLIKLRELFRNHGYNPPNNELSDHIVILLEFISNTADKDVVRSLLADLILPALHLITEKSNLAVENSLIGVKVSKNPYIYLYRALKEFITSLFRVKIVENENKHET